MAAAITVKDVRKSLVKYLPYGGAVGYSVLSLHSMNVPLPSCPYKRENRSYSVPWLAVFIECRNGRLHFQSRSV